MPRTEPLPDPRWSDQLAAGLAAMQLALGRGQRDRLLDYLALLAKWNRVYNLTAVRDPAEMVSRQLLDSLSILPWVSGPRVLDVGTGPGLPGIPLAIARPAWSLVLLDSNGKKIRFVNQARLQLGLDNVVVEQRRVEAWQTAAGFDTIVSRAFASLADMIALTGHLLAPHGCWVAMKGPAVESELDGLAEGWAVQVRDLAVPGAATARRAVIVRRC